MNDFKRQENGRKGEERSRYFLSDHFWLLNRSVDVDGVDFLVQEKVSTIYTQRFITKGHGRAGFFVDIPIAFQTLGYVQAKFFEGKNQVKIPIDYVKFEENIRLGFFAFLHTDNREGKKVHYFFTAEEIVEEWYVDKNGNYYCFSLTEERTYSDYKNRDEDKIKGLVIRDIHRREDEIIDLIITPSVRFFGMHSPVKEGDRKVTYLLRIIEKTPLVLYRYDTDSIARPLEPRRDVLVYPGDFRWGYDGTAPKFLSASILGHYLGSRRPTGLEIRWLFQNVIMHLDSDKEYDITEERIQLALGRSEVILGKALQGRRDEVDISDITIDGSNSRKEIA